jgi:hypothetical protein
MSTAARGLDGALYLSGTIVALLTGVDFDYNKPVTEFAAMGGTAVTQVLQGVRHYAGAFRHAFIDCTFHTHFQQETIFIGSLVPRVGGAAYVGSLVLTGGSITNMNAEETAAVIEEGTFVMYSVTCA